jgi:CspA family cold shock protein
VRVDHRGPCASVSLSSDGTSDGGTASQHGVPRLFRYKTRRREPRRHVPEMSEAMPTGTVKFFNGEKGYGFISREGGKDVFVHYSNIVGSGYRTLEADQKVEFEVQPGRKGDEAVNVRAI